MFVNQTFRDELALGYRTAYEFSIFDLKKHKVNYLHKMEKYNQRCFLAGTPIDMWDGTQKPIEEIASGDVVVSYDASGTLKPGRVKRTFENRVAHILDVHGLMVTPGHATYCAAGKFAGRHVPMIDILRSDGALMTRDGKDGARRDARATSPAAASASTAAQSRGFEAGWFASSDERKEPGWEDRSGPCFTYSASPTSVEGSASRKQF